MLRISPDIIISFVLFFFFFQAEDGIRDWSVTGVQTCALPISYAVFCLRSEQHTSELQSQTNFVCLILLRNNKGNARLLCDSNMIVQEWHHIFDTMEISRAS